MATSNKNWIGGAIKHHGALHKALGVPMGQKIPRAKINRAASSGGTLGRRATVGPDLEQIPLTEQL